MRMDAREDFDHLDPAGRAAAAVAVRPRAAVMALLAVAIVLAWLLLAGMAGQAARVAAPGEALPGGEWLRLLPDLPLPRWLDSLLALCLAPAPGQGVEAFAATWAMWMLMSVAMMLPSAAPMIRTYCEIADTAAAKGQAAVHPLLLVAGYLGAWAAASAGFAGLSLALQAAMPGASALAPASGITAALALAVAGLYQFSSLKQACLRKCRNPFAVLFSRWNTRPAGIVRLGFEQGLWCLGCCWALMLVMLAVGVMNLFWMVLLGLFVLVEKGGRGGVASRAAGAILLVWAAGLLVVWPW